MVLIMADISAIGPKGLKHLPLGMLRFRGGDNTYYIVRHLSPIGLLYSRALMTSGKPVALKQTRAAPSTVARAT